MAKPTTKSAAVKKKAKVAKKKEAPKNPESILEEANRQRAIEQCILVAIAETLSGEKELKKIENRIKARKKTMANLNSTGTHLTYPTQRRLLLIG